MTDPHSGSGSITDVPGITVGHWTGTRTGVTVVLCPPGTTGSGEVRGGAPATREMILLDPSKSVSQVDAVVLSGGSVFGLAAADGVVPWLVEQGRGIPTPGGVVPIVPTAALFDLVESGGERPGAAEGRAAVEAAVSGQAATGRVGAGTGATVGKWQGAAFGVPGGLGMASATVDGAVVGALAAVNAVGDVVDATGTVLAGSRAPAGSPGFPETFGVTAERGATTLVVVATNARCSKVDCLLLAQSGHDGLARAIDPAHTRYDGDLVIALATGTEAANLDRLRMAAADVVARAIRHAVGQT